MEYTTKLVTIDDYDAIFALWDSTEQSRRALNPVDDSREGIDRYLQRNPNTCFATIMDGKIIGVILSGHDGRRGIIHHLCVHPDFRRMGIAGRLVSAAEEALKQEGIQKVYCSPQGRAQQTAQPFAELSGLKDIETLEFMKEIRFGSLEDLFRKGNPWICSGRSPFQSSSPSSFRLLSFFRARG